MVFYNHNIHFRHLPSGLSRTADHVTDGTNYPVLDGAHGIDTFQTGGHTYAAVALAAVAVMTLAAIGGGGEGRAADAEV